MTIPCQASEEEGVTTKRLQTTQMCMGRII